ncbi:MAG: bifunctional 4-hydroxy-2-oxoglutarate aldolase/2-dehydro-3-deoxy-phosphogluconate aldolase [Treponema sp.]|nr:bifunctional 4-hydroxy-2-oxoglutarate aldolase/2-dehydro-3-deoxy-phosphogluconate aldolase [Spirochaetia bacterium]MDD6296128.1 bifunctional 4-hydroxy-2-oxoglutarate aldolase/2-dehydro-3-deoxy-phosphogluconate aldolase [Treponema sp.]MDD7451377.1 bifunctional 4-hydroxy-2-oxoglutarate aldolase/2-dehydro-3-deoxy-phosphogluconate aldolase [Treponema sp.]MDY2923428.1 bifunctional 4-hydroxy-2-oxoglutarate aldolase/2-dehydro-3-deoxy-phosphogluconate aldolase [Treponema sp.]MDY5683319.1 bifunctiona
MAKDVFETMAKVKVVPVIKIDDLKNTLPLIDALVAGGLPIAEITFRSPVAAEAIKIVSKERPEVLTLAGTVLSLEQAQQALDAGASAIVAPGYYQELGKWCAEKGIPFCPGVNSPSQMELALRNGLKAVKFFPAEQSGGADFLKAVSAVYPLKFMPTGGINQKNIKDYLALKNVFCCGGSWMVKADLINEGKFDEITRLTKEALELVK